MDHPFSRRIYTPGLLIQDLGYLFTHIPQTIDLMRSEAISRAFLEKIMTVVTAVNGCPYCAWFHAKMAAASGIGADEIRALLSLQFGAEAEAFELTALLFAQHYAETNRQPDPEMTAQLTGYYGERSAQHILLAIRMIYFGNLSGNTFDAFLSRLAGNPAANSSALFEAIFFVLTAPFMLPVIPLSRHAAG